MAMGTPSDVSDRAAMPDRPGWLWLAAVALAHAAFLVWAASSTSRPRLPEPPNPTMEPPAVIGMLVPASPPAATATIAPKTLPVPQAKPDPQPIKPDPQPAKPRPMQRPRPTPLPSARAAQPSERAANSPAAPAAAAPAQEEHRAAAPAAQAAQPAPATTPAAAPAPEPVVPPRVDASQLNNPAPVYPALSRRMGEQGRVLLDIYILTDGSVGEIKLKRSSGYGRLDQAAMDAVRRWRYVPARRGNEPIPYWYVQPINFSLDS